jgi:hypothetical protein
VFTYFFIFFNSDNEKSGYNENQTCGYTTLWSGYDFKNMILKLQNVNVLYSLKTLSGGNNLDVREHTLILLPQNLKP